MNDNNRRIIPESPAKSHNLAIDPGNSTPNDHNKFNVVMPKVSGKHNSRHNSMDNMRHSPSKKKKEVPEKLLTPKQKQILKKGTFTTFQIIAFGIKSFFTGIGRTIEGIYRYFTGRTSAQQKSRAIKELIERIETSQRPFSHCKFNDCLIGYDHCKMFHKCIVKELKKIV